MRCRDINYDTPLHLAVLWSRPDVVRLLLMHGAQINASNRSGATPLLVSWMVIKKAVSGKDPDLVNSAKEVEQASPAWHSSNGWHALWDSSAFEAHFKGWQEHGCCVCCGQLQQAWFQPPHRLTPTYTDILCCMLGPPVPTNLRVRNWGHQLVCSSALLHSFGPPPTACGSPPCPGPQVADVYCAAACPTNMINTRH